MTNAEKERLIKLMEECAEVIQACAKVLVYGYEDIGPSDNRHNMNNRTRLENELRDAIFWMGMLDEAGDIDSDNVVDLKKLEEKKLKALKYTRYQEGSTFDG